MLQRQHFGVVLILFLCMSTLPQRVDAHEWSTRGGDLNRQNLITFPTGLLSMLDLGWDEPNLGQTATQPIIVDNQLLVMGGAGLYSTPLTLNDPLSQFQPLGMTNEAGGTVVPTNSTPTFSIRTGNLYWGSAHGTLWYLQPGSSTPKRHTLAVGCAIVSSPLVLDIHDPSLNQRREFVVVGVRPEGTCRTAGVFIIWGLDNVGTPGHIQQDIDGYVTASAVVGLGENYFIIATDGASCGGRVLQFEISLENTVRPIELVPIRWGPTPDGCVPHGVPDGFAVHGDDVFWVDKEGYLYGRNRTTGNPAAGWRTERIDLLQGDLKRGRAFTNMVPAIDPVNDKIYVTLRSYRADGGAPLSCPHGQHECTGWPGAYAAVSLSQGTVKWAKAMPVGTNSRRWSSINTNPLILQQQDYILFGDVNGYVHQVNGKTGERLDPILLLDRGEEPMRATQAWHQISGAGTEPLVALVDGRAIFFMGVNYTTSNPNDPRDDWEKGRIKALAASGYYNLRWDGPGTITPQDPSKPNHNLTATGTVVFEQADITFAQLGEVEVHWVLLHTGFNLVKHIGSTRLTAPGQVTSPAFDLTGNHTEYKVMGVIHPAGVLGQHGGSTQEIFLKALLPSVTYRGPAWARELAHLLEDNLLYVPYQRQEQTGNLRVSLAAPAHAGCTPTTYQVTYLATNEGATPATVRLRGHVTYAKSPAYSLGTRSLTIPAGESVLGTFDVNTLYPDDTATVTVYLNEDRQVAELDYSDNQASASTGVGTTCGTGPTAPRPTGGGRATIIVPSDCQVNPDPSSAYPCRNYPDLRIPNWP